MMKKLWLMLLMISSVCIFSACSDDNDNKGENNGKNPISELYLSDEIATGESTNVLGKGFAADAQIFIQDAAGERTKIENVTVNEKGITFTLPSTVTTGQYSLILKQNGGEWTLGSFKALKMVEVTQLKKLTGYVPGDDGDEPFMDQNYSLTYDEYGRLKSIADNYEDEDGNLMTSAYEFTYDGDRIEVGGSAIDNDMVYPITFYLENGKVASSKTKDHVIIYKTDENGKFVRDEDGKLIVEKDEVMDVEYAWEYENDYLKSLTGADEINYDYVDGNLMSIDVVDEFTYGTQVNKSNVDMITSCLFLFGEIGTEQYFAYQLGICGKISTNLPTYVVGECTYKLNQEGLVEAMYVDVEDFGVMTISFEYETVKVLAE